MKVEIDLINPLNKKELYSIYQIELDYCNNNPEYYINQRIIRPIIENCGYIIGARDNKKKIIGYSIIQKTNEEYVYFFSFIHVKKEFRRLGIAKLLDEKGTKVCEEIGVKRVIGAVNPLNYPSLNLLLNKCGWQIYAFKYHYFGKNEHRFLIEKIRKNGKLIGNKKPSLKWNSIKIINDFISGIDYCLIKIDNIELISKYLSNRQYIGIGVEKIDQKWNMFIRKR